VSSYELLRASDLYEKCTLSLPVLRHVLQYVDNDLWKSWITLDPANGSHFRFPVLRVAEGMVEDLGILGS
jgi:hypothetical protein